MCNQHPIQISIPAGSNCGHFNGFYAAFRPVIYGSAHCGFFTCTSPAWLCPHDHFFFGFGRGGIGLLLIAAVIVVCIIALCRPGKKD